MPNLIGLRLSKNKKSDFIIKNRELNSIIAHQEKTEVNEISPTRSSTHYEYNSTSNKIESIRTEIKIR